MTLSRVLSAIVLVGWAGACALSTHGTATDVTSTEGSGGAGGHSSSSSTSSSSSSTTSSSSSSTTSSSSSGAPTELDCMNGIDDDGDGLADCDDPDCTSAGYGCLPPVTGMLAQVVLGGASCPAATVPRTLRSCDDASCTCTASTGNCNLAVERWDGTACNGMPTSSTKTVPTCYYPTPADSAFRGTATSNQDTTCTAGPDIASADPGACEVKGGTCGGGGACVPPAFPKTSACILLPAGATCAAPYPYQSTVYDNTGATCACACSKTGETCDVGSVLSFPTGFCGGQPSGSAPIDGQCHSVGLTGSYSFQAVSSHAQCTAPRASMPSGEATLCCSQAPT